MDSATSDSWYFRQWVGIVAFTSIRKMEACCQCRRSDIWKGIWSRGICSTKLRGDDRLTEACAVQRIKSYSNCPRKVSDCSVAAIYEEDKFYGLEKICGKLPSSINLHKSYISNEDDLGDGFSIISANINLWSLKKINNLIWLWLYLSYIWPKIFICKWT